MTVHRARHGRIAGTEYRIDRIVRNVETGRFERSLSALTAVGALVTGVAQEGELPWALTDELN